jgi:hypothetical protein
VSAGVRLGEAFAAGLKDREKLDLAARKLADAVRRYLDERKGA